MSDLQKAIAILKELGTERAQIIVAHHGATSEASFCGTLPSFVHLACSLLEFASAVEDKRIFPDRAGWFHDRAVSDACEFSPMHNCADITGAFICPSSESLYDMLDADRDA